MRRPPPHTFVVMDARDEPAPATARPMARLVLAVCTIALALLAVWVVADTVAGVAPTPGDGRAAWALLLGVLGLRALSRCTRR